MLFKDKKMVKLIKLIKTIRRNMKCCIDMLALINMEICVK